MNKRKKAYIKIFLIMSSHIFACLVGFIVGVYTLPLITAEEKPSQELIDAIKKEVVYEASCQKLMEMSFLWWMENHQYQEI